MVRVGLVSPWFPYRSDRYCLPIAQRRVRPVGIVLVEPVGHDAEGVVAALDALAPDALLLPWQDEARDHHPVLLRGVRGDVRRGRPYRRATFTNALAPKTRPLSLLSTSPGVVRSIRRLRSASSSAAPATPAMPERASRQPTIVRS